MSSIRTLLKRIMLSSAFFGIFSYASQNLVNGIAFFVNGEPVTLLELYSTIQGAKVTQDVAIDMLINKQLHDQETKKRNIQVSNLEIDNEIERIAKQHQTTSEEIHTYIENSGKSWESYKEEIKDSLIKAKLYQDITRENLRLADERELREYYQSHQEEFSIPENIEVFKSFSNTHLTLPTNREV